MEWQVDHRQLSELISSNSSTSMDYIKILVKTEKTRVLSCLECCAIIYLFFFWGGRIHKGLEHSLNFPICSSLNANLHCTTIFQEHNPCVTRGVLKSISNISIMFILFYCFKTNSFKCVVWNARNSKRGDNSCPYGH